MVDVSFHRSGKQGTEQIHQRVPEVACFYMEGLLDSAVLAADSRFKNVGLAVQARP